MPIQSTGDVFALLFTKQFLATAIGLTALYLAATAVYRLYFSPIAHFPGPRLAALTFGYEFYYDVIKQGRFTWKIGELHQQYGQLTRLVRSSMPISAGLCRPTSNHQDPSSASIR